MRKRTLATGVAAIAVLVALVFGVTWALAHRSQHMARAPTAGKAPTAKANTRVSTQQRSGTAGASPAAAPTMAPSQTETQRLQNLSTPAVYAAEYRPLPQRFAELAKRAVEGNQDAMFYAQSLVSDCYSKKSLGQTGFYFGEVTPYRTSLLASELQDCRKIAADPNFSDIKKFASSHPNDALINNVSKTLKQTFARYGARATLLTGISAIASQPSNVTVSVVAETFGKLGVSSYYASKVLNSTAAVPAGNTVEQQIPMGAALMLLACGYGMPCGPNSILVSNGCVVGGQCIPGADLAQLMRERRTSGQEWDDIMKMLAFLRQLKVRNHTVRN